MYRLGILLAIALLSGCDRSTRFLEMQADQNRRLSDLQKQVHAQQAELNRQRDHLEEERRQLSSERYREPLTAQTIGSVGLLLACLAPLLLAFLLLRRSDTHSHSDVIAEALLTDLSSESPPALIAHLLPEETRQTPRLPRDSHPSLQETD